MKIFVEVTMEEARKDYDYYVEEARERGDKIDTFEEYINSEDYQDYICECAYTDACDYMQHEGWLRFVD